MDYQEALDYVASLAPRGWRLGLDRMVEFCRILELEPTINGSTIDYFHVAGTNGKGSTTAFIQALLHYSGLNCGAFFSPYVVDPRERIQLGMELIGKSEFIELVETIIPAAESMNDTQFGGITEFEFKTAMGFMAWRDERCQAVALETGLGGRLDATNVVTPAASVIVSIGMDHQAILGDTLAKIAGEKAGIIKADKPVVVGQLRKEAAEVIESVANGKRSPTYVVGQDFALTNGTFSSNWGKFTGIELGKLQGQWQEHNFSLAVAGLLAAGYPLTEAVIQRAARDAYAPGRYQKITFQSSTVILDGAHNLDSVEALVNTISADPTVDPKELIVVSNMVQGHDQDEYYGRLKPVVKQVIIPPIDFHRARNPEETKSILESLHISCSTSDSLDEALQLASQLATDHKRQILVTGSFYLVGEVTNHFRSQESFDSDGA